MIGPGHADFGPRRYSTASSAFEGRGTAVHCGAGRLSTAITSSIRAESGSSQCFPSVMASVTARPVGSRDLQLCHAARFKDSGWSGQRRPVSPSRLLRLTSGSEFEGKHDAELRTVKWAGHTARSGSIIDERSCRGWRQLQAVLVVEASCGGVHPEKIDASWWSFASGIAGKRSSAGMSERCTTDSLVHGCSWGEEGEDVGVTRSCSGCCTTRSLYAFRTCTTLQAVAQYSGHSDTATQRPPQNGGFSRSMSATSRQRHELALNMWGDAVKPGDGDRPTSRQTRRMFAARRQKRCGQKRSRSTAKESANSASQHTEQGTPCLGH